ncbi:uncharacterized protein LOC141666145 [Apium graveolens]|uniref:uncharacterized protein LOC141666145 n=1 Tax=Apium graveolens TaxID=4045 RepID=UPI003D78EA07
MENPKPKEKSIGFSYPMIMKTNYTAWALKMSVFMQAHGVWDAIEPKDEKAVIEDKVDKRALTVIYQSIPEDLLLAIADKRSAKEASKALKTMSLCVAKFGKIDEMSVEEAVGSLKAHEEGLRRGIVTKRDTEVVESFVGEMEFVVFETGAGLGVLTVKGDESALLMVKAVKHVGDVILLKEEAVMPKLNDKMEEQNELQIWYLDNGASNHMMGRRGKFKDLDENVFGNVRFGDGSIVHIKGRGVVSFKCKNGEEKMLNVVYYIPFLYNNIISLGQLSEDKNKIVFEGDYLWVYEECGSLLMKTEEEAWLWHNGLGHVNFMAMEIMSKERMTYGIPRLVQPFKSCEGCLLLKQPHSPFPMQKNFEITQVLELVYADICCPILPITPTEVGIERQYTAPYFSQQNGVVERRNCTVAAMTGSLMKESNKPSQISGEEKLDDRSKRVVYLGREPGMRASILFDPVTGNVEVNREVVYQEKDLWPWEMNSREEVVIPEILTVFGDAADESFGSTTSDEPRTPIDTTSANNIEGSAERTGETIDSGEITDSPPRKFGSLDELYNEIGVIEMLDELMLFKVEEPASYGESFKELKCRAAMKVEFETIEKNQTWVLTNLPAG